MTTGTRKTHDFCWINRMTPEAERVRAFFGALFGWTYGEMSGVRGGPLIRVVLLLQLSLPSELPGYLLGTLRYRFRRYLIVVSVGELPFALGSVYLGESFLRGDTTKLILVALAGLGLIGLAASLLRRRLGRA